MALVMRTRLVVLVALLGVTGAACSRQETPKASRAFCLAAERYGDALERQQKKGEVDTPRQIELIEKLVAEAPKKIEQDARTFLEALRGVEQDPSIKDDPQIREAVDNVNRFANQACGVYERRGGGV